MRRQLSVVVVVVGGTESGSLSTSDQSYWHRKSYFDPKNIKCSKYFDYLPGIPWDFPERSSKLSFLNSSINVIKTSKAGL
uniref:Putative secreted protein n=1 Tax=Anopheles marajoara TaxID=58244 RepID=A0A2M4CBN8_9DIPT